MTPNPPPPDASGEAQGLGLAPRLLVSFGIFSYAVVVPLLEANASHLLNPAWPPHARIHEAWQLITHSALGAFAAWRLWRHQDLRTACLLNGLIMGSFLLAHGLQGTYGGSMVVEGRGELKVMGLNVGIGGFLLGLILNGIALLMEAPKGR